MVGSGVDIVPVRPGVNPGGFVVAVKITVTIVKPEGNIQTGDFFYPVFLGKEFRKQRLTLTQVSESGFRISLTFTERKNTVGL